MYRFIITNLLVLAFVISSSSGAKSKKQRTQLERFFSEKGSIVVIESEYIGRVHRNVDSKVRLRIYGVVMYLPGRDDKVIKGIKIDMTVGRYEKIVASAFIDSSEIPSLYSALLYIMRAREKVKNRKTNLHITYVTKGDFSMGYRQTKDGGFEYYFSISDGSVPGNGTGSARIAASTAMLSTLKLSIKRAVKYLNKHRKKINKPKSVKDAKKELDA